jgi:glycosyltransferase involved in cell wall biosynthesis
MNLLYITAARIPTEKANGIQIVKMCEALQRQGLEVTLMIPTRSQPEAMQHVTNIWHYYEVDTRFFLRYIATPDFLRFEQRFPKKLVRCLYYFQCFLFSFCALALTFRKKHAIYYTRSLQTLFLLCLTKWLHRKKVYFEAHELHGDPRRTHPGRVLLSRLMRWMVRRLDGIVVITDRLKTFYSGFGISEQRICVAPDAVDAKRCVPTVERMEAHQQLHIPLDKKVVCYTGHLFPWKGAYVLVESVKYLSDEFCIYLVGGTASDVQALKDFVAEQQLQNIEVVGYVPYSKVPLYLAAADVLVLPNTSAERISRDYTSPLKLFEYMAAQRPIVASDLPSIREVLRHRENAFLVQPDDPKNLADGIVQVINDKQLAHHLVRTASAEVRAYTWDARAARIVTFFTQQQ